MMSALCILAISDPINSIISSTRGRFEGDGGRYKKRTYRHLVLFERVDVRYRFAGRIGGAVEEFVRIQRFFSFFFSFSTTTEQHPNVFPFYPFDAEDTFRSIHNAYTGDADS